MEENRADEFFRNLSSHYVLKHDLNNVVAYSRTATNIKILIIKSFILFRRGGLT